MVSEKEEKPLKLVLSGHFYFSNGNIYFKENENFQIKKYMPPTIKLFLKRRKKGRDYFQSPILLNLKILSNKISLDSQKEHEILSRRGIHILELQSGNSSPYFKERLQLYYLLSPY